MPMPFDRTARSYRTVCKRFPVSVERGARSLPEPMNRSAPALKSSALGVPMAGGPISGRTGLGSRPRIGRVLPVGALLPGLFRGPGDTSTHRRAEVMTDRRHRRAPQRCDLVLISPRNFQRTITPDTVSGSTAAARAARRWPFVGPRRPYRHLRTTNLVPPSASGDSSRAPRGSRSDSMYRRTTGKRLR